jgi:hypothetical protein
MRKDMDKVIVERPRIKDRWTKNSHARTRAMIDSLPSNEGMRRPHIMNYGGKTLNENLSPLRRFLMSNVGRRWDDVYSEISANLRADNAVQQHVRDHIRDFVAFNVSRGRWGEVFANGYSVRSLEDAFYPLYVDPDDGILKKTPDRPRPTPYREKVAAEEMKTKRVMDDGTELRKHEGIWYTVTMAEIPKSYVVRYAMQDGSIKESVVPGSAYDVLLKKIVHAPSTMYRNGATTYCSGKKQLNAAELKKYGVKND